MLIVNLFSYSSGRVDPDKSFWVSNDNTENSKFTQKRTELTLSWPDIPIKTRQPSKPLSKSNTFIKFTHSDIGKDAAQTTVPFIDSQVVTSVPAMPLQGIGLILKGQSGYGGFITPKISTLNYSSFIKSNIQNLKPGNEL